jgi:GTP-binding protein
MSSQYQKAYFLLSVAHAEQLPPDSGIEVAIVGRSNAGKSSVLNRLTHHKQLARVSKTPGRTQMINMFVIDESRRLSDLPGYGYAKVPLAIKRAWERTINTYICERQCLKGLVLIMDIRHPLRQLDWHLLDYCDERQLPVHILLNKADKLSKSASLQVLREVRQALSSYQHSLSCQLFSALKNMGVEELETVLNVWYGYIKTRNI